MQQQLDAWFESHRALLIERFTAAGKEAEHFPAFAALKPRQYREVIRREVDGLISYMASDEKSLEREIEQHKVQSRRFLAEVPMEEQLEFLQRRVEIVIDMFMSEPGTEPLRQEFERKFEMARRYYRTQSRAIDLEQKFAKFAG